MSFLSIAEVGSITGLSSHTLRYYEKEALLNKIKRDEGGRRIYSERDVQALKFLHALRSTGMPIRMIKRYIALYREGEHTSDQRLQLLQEHENSVVNQQQEIKRNLELIRYKISNYKKLS